jgi:hypothetical protein
MNPFTYRQLIAESCVFLPWHCQSKIGRKICFGQVRRHVDATFCQGRAGSTLGAQKNGLNQPSCAECINALALFDYELSLPKIQNKSTLLTEPPPRFELGTSALRKHCSTAELRWQDKILFSKNNKEETNLSLMVRLFLFKERVHFATAFPVQFFDINQHFKMPLHHYAFYFKHTIKL